jgi:hypothetical protein
VTHLYDFYGTETVVVKNNHQHKAQIPAYLEHQDHVEEAEVATSVGVGLGRSGDVHDRKQVQDEETEQVESKKGNCLLGLVPEEGV